jgi:hypothetical protein
MGMLHIETLGKTLIDRDLSKVEIVVKMGAISYPPHGRKVMVLLNPPPRFYSPLSNHLKSFLGKFCEAR